MSWDAVVAHERSSSCCFCGTRFDGFWAQGFQLLSGPVTGMPVNLWVCGPCIPVAKTSGYGVITMASLEPDPAAVRPAPWKVFVLALAIAAAIAFGGFVAIILPTLVTR